MEEPSCSADNARPLMSAVVASNSSYNFGLHQQQQVVDLSRPKSNELAIESTRKNSIFEGNSTLQTESMALSNPMAHLPSISAASILADGPKGERELQRPTNVTAEDATGQNSSETRNPTVWSLEEPSTEQQQQHKNSKCPIPKINRSTLSEHQDTNAHHPIKEMTVTVSQVFPGFGAEITQRDVDGKNDATICGTTLEVFSSHKPGAPHGTTTTTTTRTDAASASVTETSDSSLLAKPQSPQHSVNDDKQQEPPNTAPPIEEEPQAEQPPSSFHASPNGTTTPADGSNSFSISNHQRNQDATKGLQSSQNTMKREKELTSKNRNLPEEQQAKSGNSETRAIEKEEKMEAREQSSREWIQGSDINPSDVLLRSGPITHEGNIRFHELVIQKRAEWVAGGRRNVDRFAAAIFQIITSKDPPGRFLKKLGDGTGAWNVMKDTYVLSKIAKLVAREDRVCVAVRDQERKVKGHSDDNNNKPLKVMARKSEMGSMQMSLPPDAAAAATTTTVKSTRPLTRNGLRIAGVSLETREPAKKFPGHQPMLNDAFAREIRQANKEHAAPSGAHLVTEAAMAVVENAPTDGQPEEGEEEVPWQHPLAEGLPVPKPAAEVDYDNMKKLVQARRLLFHAAAGNKTGFPCTKAFESAAASIPVELQQASSGGRQLWSDDSKHNRKRKRVSSWSELENHCFEKSSNGGGGGINRAGFASMSLDELKQKQFALNNGSDEMAGTQVLALHFSEASIACVSKWVCTQLLETGAPAGHGNVASQHPASFADSRLRMCAVCKRFGHYELECPERTPVQDSMFRSFLPPGKGDGGVRLQNGSMRNGSGLIRGQSDGGKRQDPGEEATNNMPILELFGGFLVEQSSKPRGSAGPRRDGAGLGNDADDPTGNPLVEETELDCFLIRATCDSPLPKTAGEASGPHYSEGDLVTWFPQGHAAHGALYVGVVVSSEYQGRALRVRCLSIVDPEPTEDQPKNSSGGGDDLVGDIFIIPLPDVIPVSRALEAPSPPTYEETNVAVTATAAQGPAAAAKLASKAKATSRSGSWAGGQASRKAKCTRNDKSSSRKKPPPSGR